MKISFFLIVFTIILAPLYVIRGHIPIPFLNFLFPTTLLEVMILFTALFTFFDFVKDGFNFSLFQSKFDILIFVFLIAAVFSLFSSYDFIGGLGVLRAYFIEPVLFYYCLIYQSKKKGTGYIVKSLMAASIWLSVLGFIQKMTGNYSLAPNEIAQGRISGVYNSANSFSLFVSPVSFFFIGGFLQKNKKILKVIYLLVFVFLLLTIYWTRSRGGLIAEIGALGIFVYSVFALKNKLLKKIWYFLPALILGLIAFFMYQMYLTYNFIPFDYGKPYTEGDTLQIRYFTWAGTVNLLKEHFFYGAGLNGFKTLYSNQYRLPQYQEQFQYPHNLLLTFWTETGIFGLFSFLLVLVSAISLIIKNISKSKNPIFGASLLAILCYWSIHGVVDVPYFKNDLSLEFWIILALTEMWSKGQVE